MQTNLRPQSRLLLKALVASTVLNGGMIVMSAVGGALGGGSLILRIADGIAAPPGALAERVFVPKEHSVGALATAATESLVWSIVFYAIIAWALFESVSICQWMARKRRQAHG